MRSLALAGIVAVLAGCSLPYADTSFKATPKPEHMAEGEHHRPNDRGPEPYQTGPEKTPELTTNNPDGTPVSTESPSVGGPEAPTSRTGNVFPSTAQPATQ